MSTTSELWMKVIESDGEKRLKNLRKLFLQLWDDGEFEASMAVEQELRDSYLENSRNVEWLWESRAVAANYRAIGDLESSRMVIEEVLQSECSCDEDLALAHIYKLGGEVHFQLGGLHRSKQLLEQAIEQYEQCGQSGFVADTQRELAKTLKAQGKLKQAQKQLVSATEHYAEAKDLKKTVETRIELADLLAELGQFEIAIPVLGDGLQISRFLENLPWQQAILRRLGECHSACRNDELAGRLLDQAINLKSKISQPDETLKAMESLAMHNQRIGNTDLAKKQFQQISPVKKIISD